MKELLWVEKSLIQKLKLLDGVEEIKEKDIKDLIKNFNEDVEIIKEDVNSSILDFRAKAQSVREAYETVVKQEINANNELWESLDEKRYESVKKINSARDSIKSVQDDVNRLKKSIYDIDFYGIDRLMECIEKINDMRLEDRELLSKLFDSHKSV